MDERSNQLDQPTVPSQPDQSYPTSLSSLPYPYPAASNQQYPTQPPYQAYPSQPLHAAQPNRVQPYAPPPYPPQSPTIIDKQNQSFTGKAVIAFLLYFLFYVPGLIFNIMFINEAHQVQKETGRRPSGLGCLWATLIVSIASLALVFFIFVLFIIGLSTGSGGAS